MSIKARLCVDYSNGKVWAEGYVHETEPRGHVRNYPVAQTDLPSLRSLLVSVKPLAHADLDADT